MKIPATGNLTGRAVEEWIGSSPDAAIPPRVRLRVFDRHKGVCHLTGRKIMPGDEWDIEHIKPLHGGGEHRESNMAPALRVEHRKKTAMEAGGKAKSDRIRKKHIGAWPKTKFPLKSRGFQKPTGMSDPDT